MHTARRRFTDPSGDRVPRGAFRTATWHDSSPSCGRPPRQRGNRRSQALAAVVAKEREKVTDTTSFTERLLYYPNFEESSDWRLSSDTGIQTAISSLLALKFSYENRYRNEPLVLADGSVADSTDTTTRFSVVLNF